MMTLDRPRPATLETPTPPATPAPPLPRPPYLRALAALVWKDFRPHAALIVIQWIFAATAAVLILYAAWFLAYLYQSIGPNILLYPPFLAVAGIYFPLCGLLLGFVHGLADRAPDHWALLTHRPLARTLHGPARIAAGALLYAAGAGLPYAALIFFATTRHAGAHGGFFLWPFVLPSLASFLLGFVCYLAAQLATYWHLPWKHAWGKLLPLFIPAIAAIALCDLPAFSSVLLVLALAAALLAIALAAAIATHAFRLSTPPWARLGLIAVLLAGAAFPIAWLRTQLQSRIDMRIDIYAHNHITPIHLPPEPDIVYNPITFDYHYALLPDGAIAMQHDNPTDPLGPPTFTDLQNHPIPAPKTWPTSFHFTHNFDRQRLDDDHRYVDGYRDIAARIAPPQSDGTHITYSFDGLDYHYDRASHAFLGSQKSAPFPLDAFSPPSGELPQNAVFFNTGWPGISSTPWHAFLLATDYHLYVVSQPSYTLLRQFPIDPPLTTAPVDVVLLKDPARIVLWHHMDHAWIIADTFDPDGHLLQSTEAGAEQAREARLKEDAARAVWQQHRQAAATQPAGLANTDTYRRAGTATAVTTGLLDALQGLAPTRARAYLTNTPTPTTDSYPQNPAAYRLAWWLLTLALLPLTFLLTRRRQLPLPESLLWTLSPLLLGPIPLLPLSLLPTGHGESAARQ